MAAKINFMIELTIGQYYELDYKKGRQIFLYQGQRDTGGKAHVFVNGKALYCIEPGILEKCNVKETVKPQ